MSKQDSPKTPSFTEPAPVPKIAPSRAVALSWAAPLLAALLMACQPSLPTLSGAAGGESGPSEVRARLEPASSLEAAPRVLRVVIEPPRGVEVDTSRVLFVKGHVGPRHAREAEEGDLSQALMDRALPALVFAREGDAVIAPLTVLSAGETYGVLSGEPPLAVNIRVSESEPLPILPRIWPPNDAAGAGPFAIFCGQSAPSPPPETVHLEPFALSAALHPGAAGRIGTGCLRLDADLSNVPLSAAVTSVLPPPSIVVAGTEIEPR